VFVPRGTRSRTVTWPVTPWADRAEPATATADHVWELCPQGIGGRIDQQGPCRPDHDILEGGICHVAGVSERS
jgi:hypothetical protein